MDLSKYKQTLPKMTKRRKKLARIFAIAAASFIIGFTCSQLGFVREVEVVKEIVVQSQVNPQAEEIFHRVKLTGYADISDDQLREIAYAAVKTKRPYLIVSIAIRESSLEKHTKSRKGALGLTGIIPKWWHQQLKEEGIVAHKGDYYQVENNLLACEYIVETLLEKFNGDMVKALAFYNGGTPGLKSKECIRYAKRVLMTQRTLETAKV